MEEGNEALVKRCRRQGGELSLEKLEAETTLARFLISQLSVLALLEAIEGQRLTAVIHRLGLGVSAMSALIALELLLMEDFNTVLEENVHVREDSVLFEELHEEVSVLVIHSRVDTSVLLRQVEDGSCTS